MSWETSEWLNRNALVGFTHKRGTAWHYRASDQGDEPNHYPGAIPVEDVERRLFAWEPVAGPMETTVNGTRYSDDTRKVIVRPDTGAVLGAFKDGYEIHSYRDWLLQKVTTLLDATLAVGSAGLLKGGAVAWVQVEMAETMHHPSGVDFRPFLTATTSLDGSLKTTYFTGSQLVVCDNTLTIALREADDRKKGRKHTSGSLSEQASIIRDALGLVVGLADDFSAALDKLTSAPVSRTRMGQFMDLYAPVPSEGRAKALAEHKRDTLRELLRDSRVEPWNGTEFGVLQLVNTYEQHEAVIRNVSARAERNALDFLTGKTAKSDSSVLSMLASV